MQTLRSSDFPGDIIAQDGPACVFTGLLSEFCEAAHLLPKSKGDEVCIFVVQHHCLGKCSPSTLNLFFGTVNIFTTSMKNLLIWALTQSRTEYFCPWICINFLQQGVVHSWWCVRHINSEFYSSDEL